MGASASNIPSIETTDTRSPLHFPKDGVNIDITVKKDYDNSTVYNESKFAVFAKEVNKKR